MINDNLKEAREELEMTQTELGAFFNVSKNTVSGWENGHDTMPFYRIINFCNKFDYSIDFITGLTRRNTKYGNFKTSKEEIGNKLKEIRNELNLSQQQLSNECKISQTTYSGYETGLYLINTITIITICKKYNISADYILGRTNNKFIK